ncbi:MAG: SIS domain-containing protein, partial [Clostridia bacterium]|nr:SIS domain-containing protein [Clostridia bacterium]
CYEQFGEYLKVDGSEVNMFTSIVAFLLLWIVVPIVFGFLANLLTKAIGPLASKLQSALPAIDLTQHTALSTAFLNDVDPQMLFAQQVLGYGNRGDVFLGISTSGNSENICKAATVAKALGLTVIGLTGVGGGKMAELCDVLLDVPVKVTADVQELHLPVYHTLCAMLESTFFSA